MLKANVTLNKRFPGADLYELDITPKGTKEMIQVYVYANNRLEAYNFMVHNKLWCKLHEIRVHSSSLLKNK